MWHPEQSHQPSHWQPDQESLLSCVFKPLLVPTAMSPREESDSECDMLTTKVRTPGGAGRHKADSNRVKDARVGVSFQT